MLPIGEIAARLEIPDRRDPALRPRTSPRSASTSSAARTGPTGGWSWSRRSRPTPAGEGKTTTTVGLGDALNRIGKRAMSCTPRAVAGPVLRHEGRRGRRRLRPGRADGEHQPPLHRRLPRDRQRPQPARRADRQPHLLGQRARPRPAPDRLAPRARHERPRAALDRQQPGRGRQRLPARGRLRHHGRLRGHGGVLPRDRPRRPRAAPRPHGRRPDPRARAGDRGAGQGAGADDRPAARTR